MRLYFSWENSAGRFSPACSSSSLNSDGVSPLACLLTDDGGLGFSQAISWLDEGISQIKSVKESKVDFSDWSREAWGAELTNTQAKIYSLYDESYFEIMSIDSFENALLAWRNFTCQMPDEAFTQEVEI